MRITSEIFKKSFYYIGAGFDIQPILRFTHLTDTFLYANLLLPLEEVLEWYDRHLNDGDIKIIKRTIIHDFTELDYFELDYNYRSSLSNLDFLHESELEGYLSTFKMAIDLPQYAVIYEIERISLNRKVTLYFFTGEGLASYIALSQNGKIAPIIFCTIQTGVFEHPDSLINNFFKNKDRIKPILWIRGFEPEYDFLNHYNNSLDEIGEFPKKVLDFNHLWSCGWSKSLKTIRSDRFVKGFMTEVEFDRTRKSVTKPAYRLQNHTFHFGPIGKHFNSNEIIVLSKKKKIELNILSINIIFWEDMNITGWSGADSQVDHLFQHIKELGNSQESTIHIIPYCLEDEGELYFKSLCKYNYKTITYLINNLDFIDLRTYPNQIEKME
jgi:hypothetical protein